MATTHPPQEAPPAAPDGDLLARVRPDPRRPGPDRWRVVDGDLPVWAIVQHLIAIGNLDDPTKATDAVIEEAAADYRIPPIGVRAALAYYAANRCPIDTRLAINEAVAGGEDALAPVSSSVRTDPTSPEQRLLDRVKPDPIRPGPDRWRVVDGEIAVWAIIQHLIAIGNLVDPTEATDPIIAQAADDYRIPEVGVRAALAYYAANRCPIDTRLAINEAVASRQ